MAVELPDPPLWAAPGTAPWLDWFGTLTDYLDSETSPGGSYTQAYYKGVFYYPVGGTVSVQLTMPVVAGVPIDLSVNFQQANDGASVSWWYANWYVDGVQISPTLTALAVLVPVPLTYYSSNNTYVHVPTDDDEKYKVTCKIITNPGANYISDVCITAVQ